MSEKLHINSKSKNKSLPRVLHTLPQMTASPLKEEDSIFELGASSLQIEDTHDWTQDATPLINSITTKPSKITALGQKKGPQVQQPDKTVQFNMTDDLMLMNDSIIEEQPSTIEIKPTSQEQMQPGRNRNHYQTQNDSVIDRSRSSLQVSKNIMVIPPKRTIQRILLGHTEHSNSSVQQVIPQTGASQGQAAGEHFITSFVKKTHRSLAVTTAPTANYASRNQETLIANTQSIVVSKQDLGVLTRNQSMSKEFLSQNKRELLNFIKTQSRGLSQSAETSHSAVQLPRSQPGLAYQTTARVDGSQKAVKSPERDTRLAAIINNAFYQALQPQLDKSVKPEQGFKGITTPITSKVIENWINQTLSDAENLDVPSILLHPKNKVPITRYGIDRQTLTAAGLSHDACDKIYRSLFVYSVGFYEQLKKEVQANCSQNNTLKLQMSLWKTFCVLLEYACKTEYRMLISQITAKNETEKQELNDKNQAKLEIEIQEKRQLKQIMLVMQTYQEQLEQERNNERSLRLKLEEEYMTISRNHEEEVGLRLQFESKLNQLNTEYRELDIKHKRNLVQLALSTTHLERLDAVSKDQSEKLITLRTNETDMQSSLEALQDFQTSAVKEIDKKNYLIKAAEEARRTATDTADLIKYQLQGRDNESKRVEMRLQDMMAGKIQNETVIKSLEIQIQELKDLDLVNQDQLKSERQLYDTLHLETSTLRKEYQSLKITSADQHRLLQQVQKDFALKNMSTEDHEMQALVFRAGRDDLQKNFTSLTVEYHTTVEHMQQINKQRHEFKTRCSDQLVQLKQASIEKQDLKWKIDAQALLIATHVTTMSQQKDKIDELERGFSKDQKMMLAQVQALKTTIETKDKKIIELHDQAIIKNEKINQQLKEIQGNDQKHAVQEAYIEKLNTQVLGTSDKLKSQIASAFREIQKSGAYAKQASDAIKKYKRIEETLRYTIAKNEVTSKNLKSKLTSDQTSSKVLLERCQMETEDANSRCLFFANKVEYIDYTRDAFEEARQATLALVEMKAECDLLNQTVVEVRDELIKTELFVSRQEDSFEEVVGQLIIMEGRRFDALVEGHGLKVEEAQRQIAALKESLVQARVKEVKQQMDIKTLTKVSEEIRKNQARQQTSQSKEKGGREGGDKEKESRNQGSNSRSGSDSKRGKVGQQKKGGFFEQMTKDSKDLKEKKARIGQRMNHQNQPLDIKRVTTNSQQHSASANSSFESQPADHTPLPNLQSLTQTKQAFKSIPQNEAQALQSEHDESAGQEEAADLVESLDPPTPRVDYQHLKFEEYRSYISTVHTEVQQKLQQKMSQQVEGSGTDTFFQHVGTVLQESKTAPMPEQFRNLRLTQQQKDTLQQDQQYQLAQLQVEHGMFSDSDEEGEGEGGDGQDQDINRSLSPNPLHRSLSPNPLHPKPQPSHSKQISSSTSLPPSNPLPKRSSVKSLFMDFYQVHADLLDRMVRQNLERLSKLALERQLEIKFKPESPKERVQGLKQYQFLLKMTKDPDFYSLHRGLYIEALQQAKQVREQRSTSREREASEVQNRAEQAARILKQRHQAKVAKIVVERPYLLTQSLAAAKQDQQADTHLQPKPLPQTDTHLLQPPPSDIKETHIITAASGTPPPLPHQSAEDTTYQIQELLQKLKQVRRDDQSDLAQEYQDLLRGGVAKLNNNTANQARQMQMLIEIQKVQSNAVVASGGKQSGGKGGASIRSIIRAVNSRNI